jgi:hypothetical protein
MLLAAPENQMLYDTDLSLTFPKIGPCMTTLPMTLTHFRGFQVQAALSKSEKLFQVWYHP